MQLVVIMVQSIAHTLLAVSYHRSSLDVGKHGVTAAVNPSPVGAA
jgi:hypothetical protein